MFQNPYSSNHEQISQTIQEITQAFENFFLYYGIQKIKDRHFLFPGIDDHLYEGYLEIHPAVAGRWTAKLRICRNYDGHTAYKKGDTINLWHLMAVHKYLLKKIPNQSILYNALLKERGSADDQSNRDSHQDIRSGHTEFSVFAAAES